MGQADGQLMHISAAAAGIPVIVVQMYMYKS